MENVRPSLMTRKNCTGRQTYLCVRSTVVVDVVVIIVVTVYITYDRGDFKGFRSGSTSPSDVFV